MSRTFNLDGFEIDEDDVERENRVNEPRAKRFNKHRWACDALDEIRTILKSRQKYDRIFTGDETIAVLVEELQTMFNHMEAALNYKKNIKQWEQDARDIAEKVDKMQKEAYEMGLELDRMKCNALKLE